MTKENLQASYNDGLALQNRTETVSITMFLDAIGGALALVDKLEAENSRLHRVEDEYVKLQIKTTPTGAA